MYNALFDCGARSRLLFVNIVEEFLIYFFVFYLNRHKKKCVTIIVKNQKLKSPNNSYIRFVSILLNSIVVSILSIEGTDCRLVELGKVADKTAGKV